MGLLMRSKSSCTSKYFTTNVTYMWFFPSVYPIVHHKSLSLPEVFSTHLTFEWLFSSVDQYVYFELMLFIEPSSTRCALKRLLTGVCAIVHLKVVIRSKLFTTHNAFKGFIPSLALNSKGSFSKTYNPHYVFERVVNKYYHLQKFVHISHT